MTVTVSELNIYPLKSAHGVARDTMTLSDLGPDSDRAYMLVHAEGDKRGKFISQRTTAGEKLALVKSRMLENTGWLFSIIGQDQPDSHIAYSMDEEKYDGKVRVWDSDCEVLDAGHDTALWFSKYLDMPVRLVRLPEHYKRQVDPKYSTEGDNVSLADGFPLLITNESSLSDLSHAFDDASFDMNRFRSNIVLSGLAPWEEDRIHMMRIGEAVIELCKPCTRCQIPGINQDTGIKEKSSPILKALAKFRRGNGAGDLSGVFFGQNAIPRQIGQIKLGDKVEILRTRPMHPTLEGAELKFNPLA